MKRVFILPIHRRYENVVALRVVKTIGFMTAKFVHLPFEFLEQASRRIINGVLGVSRVACDISSKPLATIEWE
jgi:GMP synthase (glutamine-hydrolysing)